MPGRLRTASSPLQDRKCCWRHNSLLFAIEKPTFLSDQYFSRHFSPLLFIDGTGRHHFSHGGEEGKYLCRGPTTVPGFSTDPQPHFHLVSQHSAEISSVRSHSAAPPSLTITRVFIGFHIGSNGAGAHMGLVAQNGNPPHNYNGGTCTLLNRITFFSSVEFPTTAPSPTIAFPRMKSAVAYLGLFSDNSRPVDIGGGRYRSASLPPTHLLPASHIPQGPGKRPAPE